MVSFILLVSISANIAFVLVCKALADERDRLKEKNDEQKRLIDDAYNTLSDQHRINKNLYEKIKKLSGKGSAYTGVTQPLELERICKKYFK